MNVLKMGRQRTRAPSARAKIGLPEAHSIFNGLSEKRKRSLRQDELHLVFPWKHIGKEGDLPL
jgi:hypothetical protein